MNQDFNTEEELETKDGTETVNVNGTADETETVDETGTERENDVNPQVEVTAEADTEKEPEKVPWYQNQGVVIKLVVVAFAIILICKGIVGLLQN